MRDASTACSDLDQFDGRNTDRQAAAFDEALLARGLEGVGDFGLAVVDDAELRRGAAHVEREHVPAAVVGAERGGGERTGCWP